MAKKKSKKKYLAYRHTFYFQTTGINGKKSSHPMSVKCIAARFPVILRLTAADVSKSIKLGGRGNTQTCSMAVCALRQADAFADHDVEGYIDWTGSRAYVVSKVNKKTGFPEECVVYRHHDNVADLNDTEGGQRRLLEQLIANGDREIKLYPVTEHSSGPSGEKKKSNSTEKKPRKRPVLTLKGANRRVAIAQLGFVP